MIQYIRGDATNPQKPGTCLIVHICNDLGLWGAGFVLAVDRRWGPTPKRIYQQAKQECGPAPLPGGSMHAIRVSPTVWVVNIVGQHGVRRDESGGPCIRYPWVEQALTRHVRPLALDLPAPVSLHMPRIGCGLAGGTWDLMGPLVERTLGDLDVTVYDL